MQSNQRQIISSPSPGMNRQWRLRQVIAKTEPISAALFDLTESAIPAISDNQILLRTLYLGTSPAQKSYISVSQSMHDKVAAGEVMRGRGVAVVVESNASGFAEGDLVIASTGWQDYSVHQGGTSGPFAIRRINKPISPASLALSVTGAAGITAYFGLLDVGNVKAGDTVVVSAAAGGVGSCAVQIAKAQGARVIAIAGGKSKCDWLSNTLGVDETIDYKAAGMNLSQSLSALCPNGIDVFFDNVGGEQLQSALANLALGARVVICGFISTDYISNEGSNEGSNEISAESQPPHGPSNYTNLLRQRASMQGFFVFDYWQRFAEAEKQLTKWLKSSKLIDTTDLSIGLETMPDALQSLFSGQNRGVKICQIAEDPLASQNPASDPVVPPFPA